MDIRSLVGKLDDACRNALEQAAALALSRTNFNVEIAATRRCRWRCEEAGQLARIPAEELKRDFAVATEDSTEVPPAAPAAPVARR